MDNLRDKMNEAAHNIMDKRNEAIENFMAAYLNAHPELDIDDIELVEKHEPAADGYLGLVYTWYCRPKTAEFQVKEIYSNEQTTVLVYEGLDNTVAITEYPGKVVKQQHTISFSAAEFDEICKAWQERMMK